jgi:hypothetical protein
MAAYAGRRDKEQPGRQREVPADHYRPRACRAARCRAQRTAQTLAADGSAPIAWSVTSGSLPEGLTLSNDGTISGTPTAAGTYTFDVEAKNDYGSKTGALTIEIKAAPTGSVSVSVTPDAIRLPSVTEGYEPQEPKYITIKNTGDQTIQLKEHGKDPWLIITLDKTTLEPDEEATMKIKLKDGLSADTPSTLKAFLSYTGEDGTKGQAHFSITYEIKHDMERVDAKEPTHLEDGNIECWYCAYCQKYYKGAAGANELSLEEIIIPKLKDHTADGTGWHSDETNHWNTCACGEKLNTAAHTFAWITDKEATATENGSKHEECTVCGYAKAGGGDPGDRHDHARPDHNARADSRADRDNRPHRDSRAHRDARPDGGARPRPEDRRSGRFGAVVRRAGGSPASAWPRPAADAAAEQGKSAKKERRRGVSPLRRFRACAR